MSGHPIIFSAPMVRALIAGRKTMTRRLAMVERTNPLGKDGPMPTKALRPSPWQRVQPGDRLWVREAFAPRLDLDETDGDERRRRYALYRADRDDAVRDPMHWHPYSGKWTPPIHMPRWASRITLVVTAARVEPLQAITEADARAEGLEWVAPTWGVSGIAESWNADPRLAFAELWDTLHEPPDGWANDPAVVALSYTVHRCNIDAMPAPPGAEG